MKYSFVLLCLVSISHVIGKKSSLFKFPPIPEFSGEQADNDRKNYKEAIEQAREVIQSEVNNLYKDSP